MKGLNWMNSARTKHGKRALSAFILILAMVLLSGCSLRAIPESIVGNIVREIIARDYDLWYAETEDEEESSDAEDAVASNERTGVTPTRKPENRDDSEEEEAEPEDEEEDEEEDEDGGYGEYEDSEDEEDEEVSVSENSENAEGSGSESSGTDEDEMASDKKAYYFSTLSSSEKKLYLEIYNSIIEMTDKVVLSSTDTDEVDRVFNLCLMDHPDIFYCDGYKASISTIEDKPVSISFEGKYNVSREERKQKEEKIRAAVDKALSGVPKDESDYEKAKYVFEWIIDNTAYDLESPDNQNISSVFLNGRSVCQGYTYAYKYLLNKLGIFCTIVYGEAVGSNHAWNLARLDGTYCFIDVTWGDSSYRDKNDNEANRTSYNYFGCNSDILKRTHTINNKGEIPECTSLDEYYYVKEAKYFTKVDLDRLKAVFDHEAEKGEHMFTIRASSEEVYNELCDTLFEKREVFNLVPDAASVTYIEDKDEYTLTFTV